MLVLVILISFFAKLASGNADSIQQMQYARVKTCLTDTESRASQKVSSKLDCGSLCAQNASCRSFSVETSMPGTCYLSSDVLMETGCDDDIRHFNKLYFPCLNGGIYTENDDSCQCFHGYIGARCERLMYDCSEGSASTHYNGMTGVFSTHPPTSPAPFIVWCNMNHRARTYIMTKVPWKNYVDFNRTWEEYKNGFGDMTSGGNFWLGNERLHYLTSHRPMTLLLEILTNQELWNHRQRFYTNFKISHEENDYRCSYDTTHANNYQDIHKLGDCLATQNAMAFSTIDNDNDVNPDVNCAETHLSGWWFSDCGGCNPTGKLQPMSDTYQNSDPTYISLPVESNWAPTTVHMYLEYYD